MRLCPRAKVREKRKKKENTRGDKDHEGEMDSRLKTRQGGWRSETMDYSVRHETGARESNGEREGESKGAKKREEDRRTRSSFTWQR